MSYEVKNAVIDGTNLGVEHTDHGILSFLIALNYGGSGQGYGQLVLDTVNPVYVAGDRKAPVRAPTPLASALLLGIDTLFHCDWEKLIGKPCRAYGDFGRVAAIGAYLDDKWLWYDPSKSTFVVTPFEAINAQKPER